MRGVRRLRAALPALTVGAGCGALAALALPPVGWWPAAELAWALVALSCARAGAARRAAIGAGVGLVWFAVGLGWLVEFSGPGAVAAVGTSAAFVAAALAATSRRGLVVGLPSAVTLAEALRDRVPLGGDPMAGWALGAAGSPLAPVVRLGGSLALVWCTVAVGAVLAAAGRAAWARRPPGRSAVATAAAVGALVAGGTLDAGATHPVGALTVALVQGGGPLGTRAVHTDPDAVFRRALAESSAVRPPVDLVVWAESTLVSQVPFATSRGGQLLAGLATSLHTTVVAGVEQRDGPQHARNLAVAYGPDGSVAGAYTKRHLVPFGEHVPARSVIGHVVDLRDTPYDTVPGSAPPVLATPAGRLGVMISFEVFFDGAARDAARQGGLLVVPTDTASFRSPSVTSQELAACRLRAEETGRDLAVVGPTGVSAVVAADGSVVARTAIGAPAVIERSVGERSGSTVFDAVGSWPVLALAAAALALAAVRSPRAVKREPASPTPGGATQHTVRPW